MDGSDNSNLYLRKVNKPLMERKRRQRINSCLDQIKSILIDENNKENRCPKLEKADILEMAVRHLKHSVRNPSQLKNATNCNAKTDQSKYDLGYKKCVDDVLKFFDRNENSCLAKLKAILMEHLQHSIDQHVEQNTDVDLERFMYESVNDKNKNSGRNSQCVNIAPKPNQKTTGLSSHRVLGSTQSILGANQLQTTQAAQSIPSASEAAGQNVNYLPIFIILNPMDQSIQERSEDCLSVPSKALSGSQNAIVDRPSILIKDVTDDITNGTNVIDGSDNTLNKNPILTNILAAKNIGENDGGIIDMWRPW